MCSTCGCSEGNVQIEGHSHGHDHHHHHHEHDNHSRPVIIHHHHYHHNGDVNHYYYDGREAGEEHAHGHSHEHSHSHEHEHHHSHDHEHDHDHAAAFEPVIDKDNMHYGMGEAGTHAPGLTQKRMVQIEMGVLDKNNQIAVHNREHLQEQGILALNLVSSPGSGKTTLLTRTLNYLKDKVPCAVIEGDQQTTNDAERIRATGVPAIQVNTGKGCHLDAQMVHDAMHHLGLKDNSLLFIENVGNLVCPAGFDLGEQHKVAILSVTEGEDKPLKYPHMFAAADLMLINKIDLLPYVNVNIEACVNAARRVNPDIDVIVLSATTGEGMDEWVAWLQERLSKVNQRRGAAE
ncbi:TPA: hydrogenase nickel incorporation protein HypB [Morganella morganii]|uniref:hydrogenase nickel incorporation protein HypB n=1 Tax=Morganella morganii TaxID=582 RepID=UPI00191CAC14|nr:hydrogenase nickel incorporation protein HypB [Morganella morganii]QQU42036.1 hydrogenase nickel incorporation protein HypB [Morganella morganii]HCR3443347.1 hydrogenase nickel incorporation protein HypB [Morganella morganii]